MKPYTVFQAMAGVCPYVWIRVEPDCTKELNGREVPLGGFVLPARLNDDGYATVPSRVLAAVLVITSSRLCQDIGWVMAQQLAAFPGMWWEAVVMFGPSEFLLARWDEWSVVSPHRWIPSSLTAGVARSILGEKQFVGPGKEFAPGELEALKRVPFSKERLEEACRAGWFLVAVPATTSSCIDFYRGARSVRFTATSGWYLLRVVPASSGLPFLRQLALLGEGEVPAPPAALVRLVEQRRSLLLCDGDVRWARSGGRRGRGHLALAPGRIRGVLGSVFGDDEGRDILRLAGAILPPGGRTQWRRPMALGR